MRFLIADAFTKELFGGNPAGIVLIPDGSDWPACEVMKKTAAELRYSETAFIKRLSEKEFKLRYFTPEGEIDLCGHATIASFYALMKLGYLAPGDTAFAHTNVGKLEINVSSDFVMMEMGKPALINVIEDEDALVELYRVLGISWHDKGTGYKPQIIATGIPDLLVPVDSLETLNSLKPDFDAVTDLTKKYDAVSIHAFTLESLAGETAHARDFAPLYGIPEEAATGTASGALAYWFYLNKINEPNAKSRIIQGEAMGRPSEILTETTETPDGIRVKVGGSAAILAQGEINI